MTKRKAAPAAPAPPASAPPPSPGGLFASILGASPPSDPTSAPTLAALFSGTTNEYVRKPGEELGAAPVKKSKLAPARRGDAKRAQATADPPTPARAAQAARAAAAAAAARAAEAARGGGRTGGVHGLEGVAEASGSEEDEDGSTSTSSSDGGSGSDDEGISDASGPSSAAASDSEDDDELASSSDEEEGAKPAPALPAHPPRDPAAEAARLARTVFVSNVSPTMKRKALASIFSAYGPVEAVRLRSVALSDKGKAAADRRAAVLMAGGRVTDGGAAPPARPPPPGSEKDAKKKPTVAPRRGGAHAYIVFETVKGAKAALAHNMRLVGGLHVRVDMAAPPRRAAADAWAGRMEDNGAEGLSPSASRPAFDKARSVFVGNLPPAIEDEALIAAFGGAHVAGTADGGCVTAVRCVRDARTGEGRGVAFVELADKGAAAAALARDGTLLAGRPLRVTRVKDAAGVAAAKKAKARREAPLIGRRGRGRGGGRGGGRGFGGRGGTPSASLPPTSFQGVRTKGGSGKVSGGAASAPRVVRGGGAGRSGGRGRGGRGGGRSPGRPGAAGGSAPDAAGPRVKRPAVAARKTAGK